MRPSSARRKSDALADRFTLEETYLATPDRAALKSALIRGVDRANDEPVVLKYWDKTGSPIDADPSSPTTTGLAACAEGRFAVPVECCCTTSWPTRNVLFRTVPAFCALPNGVRAANLAVT
jgi:hypothetical protein